MNLYTHLVLAHRLEKSLQPLNREDYYLGAIVPDIRYYLGLPRHQTHLPVERIAQFAQCYPDLESFAQGYLVHCQADRVDVKEVALGRLPLRLVRDRLPVPFAPVLLEFYYLEKVRLNLRVAGSSNEILDELGVEREDVADFAGQVNQFLADPGFETGLAAAQSLGLLNHPGVQRYLDVAQRIRRNGILKRLLFAGIDATAVERRVEAQVLPVAAAMVSQANPG